MIARRLRVRGRVQGVGYRDWACGEARERGLSGWVRNRADGTVELVVRGREEAVDALIDTCRRGPMVARVDSVDVEDADELVSGSFVQKPTL